MAIYLNSQRADYAFCYLSLVTDCYTKEIVGWCVSETLEARFAIEALNMALCRLDWRTPAEAALCTGEMKKKWVSYREKAIKALVA